MKTWLILLGTAVFTTWVLADDAPKTVTAEEAAKMVGEKVVVEMEVKSASLREDVCFLNSRESFRDSENFTIFIGRDALAKFRSEKIDDPAAHFKGKKVRVRGKVALHREKPQVALSKPDEIEIVTKKP